MKAKCASCKKKRELVDRSDYCKECYDIAAVKIKAALQKVPRGSKR